MKLKKTIYLERFDQFKALSSDLRMRIVQSLRDGKASIAEIADRLGRPPASLYHHVHKLAAAGIVAVVETRKKGRRYEDFYATTAEYFEIRYDPGSPESRELLRRVFRTVLRLTAQDGDASITGGVVVKSGAKRNSWLNRTDIRLTRDQVKRILTHLEAINEITAESEGSAKGRPYTLSSFLFPLLK